MVDNRSIYRPCNPQQVAMSTSAAKNALPFTQGRLRLNATCPFFFLTGDNTVNATPSTGIYSSGGLEQIAIHKDSYISVVLASGTGTLYVSELA